MAPVEPTPADASLGIALGGGAARGWTHIGVLKTLGEHGIFPGIVAGTSIGAVVGGFFAADRLEALERFAVKLTRADVLQFLDLRLGRPSLLGGSRLAARLQEDLGDLQIEDLPRRFVGVATEIGTGREVWITQGPLVAAMQASYALPGVFAPTKISGRMLADGAFVNPVPVSAARALGATQVIAVDVIRGGRRSHSHPPATGEPPPQAAASDQPVPPAVPASAISPFTLLQRRMGDVTPGPSAPDILLTPQLGSVALYDFDRAQHMIERGAQAALDALPAIQAARSGGNSA